MDRIPLKAQERTILGKKVKRLRAEGFVPGHVFGKRQETEHVSVKAKDFLPVLHQAGETGLIDLKIGAERVRPVMIRGVQYDPVKGGILNVDFYQVNLSEKVKVPVPVILKEMEEPAEIVKLGEASVLQVLNEVEVEALPTDLIENIEVDISNLQAVDDAITVGDLNYNRETITVLADPEEVVVKLAPVVVEVIEEPVVVEGEEGVEGVEGEEAAEGEKGEGEVAEGGEEQAKVSGEEKKEG